jgi:hypothetical protein
MGGHRSDHLGVVLDVLERGVTRPAVADDGAALALAVVTKLLRLAAE